MAEKGLSMMAIYLSMGHKSFVNDPDTERQDSFIGQNLRKTLQDLAKLGGSKRKAAFFSPKFADLLKMPEVQKSANGSVFHSALCKIGQLPNLRSKSGTLDLPYFAGCANHPPNPQVPAVKECPPDTLLSPGRASLEYRKRKYSAHNGNSARSSHTTKNSMSYDGGDGPKGSTGSLFFGV